MSIDLVRWADAIVRSKSKANAFMIVSAGLADLIFARAIIAKNKAEGNTMNIMTAEIEPAIGPVISRALTKCLGNQVRIAFEIGHSDRTS